MTHHALRITKKLIILSITFFAFAIRIWNLGDMPPGWRDDELINSLVISQHVLDGEWALYYADASGHEALYHVLNAFFSWCVWGQLGRDSIAFCFSWGIGCARDMVAGT